MSDSTPAALSGDKSAPCRQYVGCTHLAAAPLDGRRTRVVLSNTSHRPAIVLSADMRLATGSPPKPQEPPHAE